MEDFNDDDVDGDVVSDLEDVDFDNDGIRNDEDTDDNNDGINDLYSMPEHWRTISLQHEESVRDHYDGDLDNDGEEDFKDDDVDGDNIVNTEDKDDDNDGIKDIVEYANINKVVEGVNFYIEGVGDSIPKEYHDLIKDPEKMQEYVVKNLPDYTLYVNQHPEITEEMNNHFSEHSDEKEIYEKYLVDHAENAAEAALYAQTNPDFISEHSEVVVRPEFRSYFESKEQELPSEIKSYFESHPEAKEDYEQAKSNYEQTRGSLSDTELKEHFESSYEHYGGYSEYSTGYSEHTGSGDYSGYAGGGGFDSGQYAEGGHYSGDGGGGHEGGGDGGGGGGGGH